MNGSGTATTPVRHAFKLLGGQLCLDFVNTVDWRGAARPQDRLVTYGDLLSWGRQAGALTVEEAAQLARRAVQDPTSASEVLERAIVLREAVYRLLSAALEGMPAAREDLRVLNSELALAFGRLRLRWSTERGGYHLIWSGDPDSLDRPLWAVAESAASLLLTPSDLARLRRCADESCGWLFLDMSRNRSRRWCAMRDCGNRAKARSYYRRHRNGREPPLPDAVQDHEPSSSDAAPDEDRKGTRVR